MTESQEKEKAAEGQVVTLDKSIIEQTKQIEKIENQVVKLENVLAMIPKNPSYDELMEFMEEDKTDEIEFRGHAYLLQEFLRNAAKNGIKGYPITVWIVTAIQITATSAIQNKEATKFMAMINEDNTYR